MSKLSISAITFTMCAVTFPARAIVTAVGVDTTTNGFWRTAAALETDHQYGTNGYIIYGLDADNGVYSDPYSFDKDRVVLPAQITGITTNSTQMWSGNGNFGSMQDPALANAFTHTPLLVRTPGNTTFNISRTENTAFRLTLLTASGDSVSATFVNIVSDGSGSVQQSSTHTSNGLHYHVFDISAGSSNIIITTNVTTAGGTHFSLTGFAFDNVTAVPEPSSLALFAGAGTFVFVMGRRRIRA